MTRVGSQRHRKKNITGMHKVTLQYRCYVFQVLIGTTDTILVFIEYLEC